jgi:hypothetical protein
MSPSTIGTTNLRLLAALIVLGAVVFVAVPLQQLLGPGPFAWHATRPAFWQGGLEALALVSMLAAGFALNRRGWLVALAALPALFYVRRHAVDVPLLIDVVYLETMVGLGMAVMRALRRPGTNVSVDYLRAFVLGFLVWSIVAWTLSALGWGSIKQLRWMTLLLVVPAAFGRTAPLVVHLWRRMREQEAAARAWCGALAAWLLVLFARSNVVVGYDPLWYGLRGNYVLDSGHSVFESLGLVSPVYYFPKLFEVFLLPVTAFGDFSVVDGVTILLLIPCLLACRLLMQKLDVPPRAHGPTLALAATLPALANSAIGPKPDVMALLLVLLAAIAACDVARSRSSSAAVWMVACAGLACLAKLTAIPYVAALIVATILCAWRAPEAQIADSGDACSKRLAWTALAATLVVAAFVTARTWLLTGLPTIGPDPLFKFWLALGMRLREPVGSLRWTYPADWPAMPGIVFDVLLRPHRDLPHMIITWIGNAWLWLASIAAAAAALLRARGRMSRAAWIPLAALAATGAYLFLGVGYGIRGSDGNYFLCAMVPAILLSAGAAFGRLEAHPALRALASSCVIAFVLFQAGYSFISAGWGVGTRAFDLHLGHGWHDTRKLRRASLERDGLSRIADYLKAQPNAPRAVGETVSDTGHWLPARFESLDQISYSRPGYVGSASEFRRFLAMQKINYLVLPLDSAKPAYEGDLQIPPAVTEAAKQLASLPGVRRIDDQYHYLLDLSAADPSSLSTAVSSDSR